MPRIKASQWLQQAPELGPGQLPAHQEKSRRLACLSLEMVMRSSKLGEAYIFWPKEQNVQQGNVLTPFHLLLLMSLKLQAC